jgi:acetoacetyl-CoA synthetase
MLSGAIPLLYEGTVNYPNVNILWELAEKAKINHFGGNTAYFTACIKENLPLQGYRLNPLQTITSTDAALSSEGFEWIYQKFKKDVWLISLNSNNEIGSSFVGGCPTLPVYPGETQCRLLGCKLETYDKKSASIGKEPGEVILSQPMPSMPLAHFKS